MNSIQLISAENKLNGTYDKDCDHITFGNLSRLKKGSNPFLYLFDLANSILDATVFTSILN